MILMQLHKCKLHAAKSKGTLLLSLLLTISLALRGLKPTRGLPLFNTSLLIFFCLIVATKMTYAEQEPSKAYKIKASFLLQFTSYVTWPENNSSKIFICIVGKDPFGKFIDEMIAARPTNRKGQAINIRRSATGDPIQNCSVVFITHQNTDDKFWQSLAPDHTSLLVSDSTDFLHQGGMISLNENKKRIQLNVNLENSDQKKIIISPQLLRVSKIITTSTPKE